MPRDRLGLQIVMVAGDGERCRAVLTADDVLARLSGDEFVILRKTDALPEAADQLMTDLLRTISQPIQIGGQTVTLTANTQPNTKVLTIKAEVIK